MIWQIYESNDETLPILIPPGTMAETSPGTVFLLAAMWHSSITRSTLDPSMP